ncbi:MAG: hypothetical protein H0X62_13850 [Bacteroidetes bacterium]|nr:hypothetical protein [Bacteroidota bacterium]
MSAESPERDSAGGESAGMQNKIAALAPYLKLYNWLCLPDSSSGLTINQLPEW